MSVHAGTIITVGGNNVIDRIQSAGLGNVAVPVDAIREVGNELVVDKVQGDPDFTFTLNSLDVSTELMAWLTGKVGSSISDPTAFPGAADAAGTEYKWEDCTYVNVASPWKDPNTGSTGTVVAGHLIPGYYPTSITYRFGVTDNATQEVALAGGAFYYAASPPVEEFAAGDGTTAAFVTSEGTVKYRKGGAGGTTFRNVFGVIVGGVLMSEGTDYTVTGGDGSPATITFATPPATDAVIRFAYFTTVSKAFPQAVHASTIVKPGAVRGRNIEVWLGTGGARKKLGQVQSVELTATIDGVAEREMGNDELVGRTINGRDTTGTITIRSKDAPHFIDLLTQVTGVANTEVYGWLNLNTAPLEIVIEDPKNPGTAIKTLYVSDAQFQTPGTPAQVNTPTDFAITFQSVNGTFSEFRGAKP